MYTATLTRPILQQKTIISKKATRKLTKPKEGFVLELGTFSEEEEKKLKSLPSYQKSLTLVSSLFGKGK